MENFDREQIGFTLIYGVMIVVGLYVATWVPIHLLQIQSNPEYSTQKRGLSHTQVTEYMIEVFQQHNLNLPEMQRSTVEVDNPAKITGLIIQQLHQRDMEAYLSNYDKYIELRVYDISGKRYQIRFIEKIERYRIPPRKNSPAKAKLSIVFSDVGSHNVDKLINLDAPVTFAIAPYGPLSMRIAQQAALHWHEVVMDIRDLQYPRWNVLPYYSGVFTLRTVEPPSQFTTQLFPLNYLPTKPEQSYKGALTGFGGSAKEILQQGITSALQTGEAIVVISSRDPQINTVVEWIVEQKNNAIQLVLLSEVGHQNL